MESREGSSRAVSAAEGSTGRRLTHQRKKKARSTGCAVQQDRSQAHARADAQMFYRAAESAFAYN